MVYSKYELMVEFQASEFFFFARLCPPGDAQNTLLRLCVDLLLVLDVESSQAGVSRFLL